MIEVTMLDMIGINYKDVIFNIEVFNWSLVTLIVIKMIDMTLAMLGVV
jgi:hypothetical protein